MKQTPNVKTSKLAAFPANMDLIVTESRPATKKSKDERRGSTERLPLKSSKIIEVEKSVIEPSASVDFSVEEEG